MRSRPPRLTLRRKVQNAGVTSLQMHMPGCSAILGESFEDRSMLRKHFGKGVLPVSTVLCK